MALDLIFPLSDGGRRSGLDLKKTRTTDQAKGFSKRCYLGRETHLFDPSTFFEFTLFLRMRGSSLLLTVVSASFRRSAWNIYWVSYGPHSAASSCQNDLPAAHSPPLLLAGPFLSILTIFLLTATATLLLFLLQRQLLIGIIIDKIIHVASFLTLKDAKQIPSFMLPSLQHLMNLPSVKTLTRPPPLDPFFFSFASSFGTSAKLSRFLVFSTYMALCSRSFFCSSSSLLRFSSY